MKGNGFRKNSEKSPQKTKKTENERKLMGSSCWPSVSVTVYWVLPSFVGLLRKKKTKKNEKKWNGLLGLSRVSLQIFDEIPNNGENDPKKEVQSQYLKKYFIVV